MAPKPKKTSHNLSLQSRRKQSHGMTPKQIIETLTRDGDFAYFEWSKRMSIRRYADYNQLKVIVTKLDDGRGCVERIWDILDDPDALEQARLDILAASNKPKSIPNVVSLYEQAETVSMPLIDIFNDIMKANPNNIDLQDRILNALFDYKINLKNLLK